MKLAILPFFLLLINTAIAQPHNLAEICAKSNQTTPQFKTTLATPEEADYDVKYVKLDLNVTNTSTSIKGNAITKAVTTVAGFNVYAFELDTTLVIDSFKFNGQLMPVNGAGIVKKVNLSPALPTGSYFTAQVFYHGIGDNGNGQFFTHGLNHITRPSGTEEMYTLSDPYLAKDWWPCKQDLQDKIDSVEVWATIPAGLKAGSNGLLKAVVPGGGGMKTYQWATHYPIDYYLISLAVAPFAEDSYYMHFTDGSGDSMLIQNYVYDSSLYMTPAHKSALDSTGLIVDYLSKCYGKYPFYKEKYGHCIAEDLGGGMEHQTMTTLAYAETPLISHEMGHQWWGDHVTYSSWRDIWLSEGFASYTEQLFVEHFWGAAAWRTYRANVFSIALGAGVGSVYVDDTTSTSRVFDSKLTYNKGASVVHMLRYLAPADSLFFKGLKTYQQQYAFSNATTADFQKVMEQTYGVSLDTFFRQWVYGEGYPTYGVHWYQKGNMTLVQLKQTTSTPSSVPVFWMPVEIKLKSASSDTVFRIFNNQPVQTIPFYWDQTVTGVEVDPNDNILNRSMLVVHDSTVLNAEQLSLVEPVRIYPNPATDVWHVANIEDGSMLYVIDVMGRIVYQKVSATADEDIALPASGHGNYILTIIANGNTPKHYKLVK